MRTLKDKYIKPTINNKIKKCRIDTTVLELLQQQIKHENENAIIYSQLRALCITRGYEGSAKLFESQTKGELEHAKKFIQYIGDRGGDAKVDGGGCAVIDWTCLCDAYKLAMSREIETTEKIVNIARTTVLKGDLVTRQFMDWFLNEQIEEEALFDNLIEELENIEKGDDALRWFDENIGWKYNEPPSIVAND
jgi:ferritin